MGITAQAVAWVRREPETAVLIAAALYLVLLVLIGLLWARQGRLARKQARFLRGVDGASLERMLVSHGDRMVDVTAGLAEIAAQSAANAESLRSALRKVAVVRYDAFAESGGRQSFSVALLDEEANGLVLTGIHSRSDLRVYAKPVVGGDSPLALTGEEREAIDRARAGGPELHEPERERAGRR